MERSLRFAPEPGPLASPVRDERDLAAAHGHEHQDLVRAFAAEPAEGVPRPSVGDERRIAQVLHRAVDPLEPADGVLGQALFELGTRRGHQRGDSQLQGRDAEGLSERNFFARRGRVDLEAGRGDAQAETLVDVDRTLELPVTQEGDGIVDRTQLHVAKRRHGRRVHDGTRHERARRCRGGCAVEALHVDHAIGVVHDGRVGSGVQVRARRRCLGRRTVGTPPSRARSLELRFERRGRIAVPGRTPQERWPARRVSNDGQRVPTPVAHRPGASRRRTLIEPGARAELADGLDGDAREAAGYGGRLDANRQLARDVGRRPEHLLGADGRAREHAVHERKAACSVHRGDEPKAVDIRKEPLATHVGRRAGEDVDPLAAVRDLREQVREPVVPRRSAARDERGRGQVRVAFEDRAPGERLVVVEAARRQDRVLLLEHVLDRVHERPRALAVVRLAGPARPERRALLVEQGRDTLREERRGRGARGAIRDDDIDGAPEGVGSGGGSHLVVRDHVMPRGAVVDHANGHGGP